MIRTAQDTSDVDLVREMLDLGLKEGNAGLKVHNSAVRALIELEEPDLALEIFQVIISALFSSLHDWLMSLACLVVEL